MRINSICVGLNSVKNNNYQTTELKTNSKNSTANNQITSLTGLPYVVFFGEKHKPRRIEDIDYFKYNKLSDNMKQILRKRYANFETEVKPEDLNNANKRYMPLKDDRIMKQFIDVCDLYRGLKNEPILCLGRSPKWFLNTALWMKDGLDDYKGVAFSKYWYRKTPDGLVKIKAMEPTPEEKKAYKRYLKRIQADPAHIVHVHEKTGKKVVITDYISSGKGACSFLDIMSEFAEEEGILEDFAKSIRIYGIGCMEYLESMYYDDEEISEPEVQLPERLMPYKKEIPQEYHDMPIEVFQQMLINENTNECRSSYYPPETWTLYSPNRYRTGMLSEKTLTELREKAPRNTTNYTTAMRDFRNLLNFRILDYLAANNLLRENLNSKQWD